MNRRVWPRLDIAKWYLRLGPHFPEREVGCPQNHAEPASGNAVTPVAEGNDGDAQ